MEKHHHKNSIPNEERIILGCKASAGENISELAREYGTNREFIYQQKEKIMDTLNNSFDKELKDSPSIALTNKVIEKMVFGCMVICKGSTEDTQEFMEQIFNLHLSVGTISNIINSFADKAAEFNQSISLSKITVGAHDEIFQASEPVLVGVDVRSTFIYLMEDSDTREADDWELALLEKKDHGLELETSVNDDGTGLKKGVKNAFPGINMQSDIFHAERKISLAVYNLERAAYKAIGKEYEFNKKCDKKKDKYLEAYEDAVLKSNEAIEAYDKVDILYGWIREALGIGGESYDERIFMLQYTADELDKLENKSQYLKTGISYIKNHQKELLTFIDLAQKQMVRLAKEEGIDANVLLLMWEQKGYRQDSYQYNMLEAKIGSILKEEEQYTHVRGIFQQFIDKIIRSSSIVECINSLIRPYIFLKRVVRSKFLDLLQFYLNTRKYQRSRRKERIGKSPIELLTGKDYAHPLEILGY